MLTIKNLYDYFTHEENPKFFLTDVFSWRGSYDEVAFSTSHTGSKERSIELINQALTEEFYGYKGGEYTYNIFTEVHFEPSFDTYTPYISEQYLKDRYNCEIT